MEYEEVWEELTEEEKQHNQVQAEKIQHTTNAFVEIHKAAIDLAEDYFE